MAPTLPISGSHTPRPVALDAMDMTPPRLVQHNGVHSNNRAAGVKLQIDSNITSIPHLPYYPQSMFVPNASSSTVEIRPYEHSAISGSHSPFQGVPITDMSEAGANSTTSSGASALAAATAAQAAADKIDQFFKTKMCIPFTRGQCRRGGNCW